MLCKFEDRVIYYDGKKLRISDFCVIFQKLFHLIVLKKTLIIDFNSGRHYKFGQNYNYQIYNSEAT